MNEDVVANQTAEVIDLKTYREQKAELHGPADALAHAPHYKQAPLSAFAMPVAFFVFWPTWIFTLQGASVSDRGGNGAA